MSTTRTPHALVLAGAGVLLLAASSCVRPPGGGDGCPDVMCLMYCEHGFETDAAGCATCACKDAPAADAGTPACDAVACTLWCPAGFAIDPATGCQVCSCNPEVSCWGDNDCAQGQRCDTVNYCQPPPGCDPGEDCPAVCAGLCVPATEPAPLCFSAADCANGERCTAGNEECLSPCADPNEPCMEVCAGHCVPATPPGECKTDSDCGAGEFCAIRDCAPPDEDCIDAAGVPCDHACDGGGVCLPREPSCEGAWLDQNGTCRTPWDGVYPDACCANIGPTDCLNGPVYCDMEPPACPSGSVPSHVNGCYGPCVDPRTCEPVKRICGDESQVACDRMPPVCPEGLVPSVSGLCWGPCVDPVTCEPPPTPGTCDDGSTLACRRMVPDCAPPFQVAIVDGCYACLEPQGCQPACAADSDCDAGEACVVEVFDPCANVDPAGPQCGAPAVRYQVCRPRACPDVMCTLYCEYGFATDPSTGCPTCRCNPPPTTCVCTEEYAPVCGTDGVTYSNACFARCANATVAHTGECRADCNIQCFRYDPVCGTNGVTYACGAAEAECNGVQVAYPGECRDGCVCTREYAPQCGTDGVTYGNACMARCAGATIAHAGECRPAPGTCTDNSQCSWGQKCFTGRSADPTVAPAGRCVAADYCEQPADCDGLAPTQSCAGGWTCRQNTCAYVCR